MDIEDTAAVKPELTDFVGACIQFTVKSRLSEVRSAHEVTLVDAMNGADGSAGAATGALIVINSSKVVYNGDCTVGAGLLTLLTADAAVGAILSYVGAGVVVRALDNNAGGIVDKVNNAVGAGACTNAAANTLTGVNLCHAAGDADGVFGTYGDTVTVAKAGIGAKTVTAVCEVCVAAGLDTDVVVLLLYNIAGAVAGNVCDLLDNVLCLNAEDRRNILCCRVTAGGTEVGSGLASVGESLCVAVAARVAASATVCAGQAVTDSNELLILLDGKEDVCNGEKHRAESADTQKKKCRV